jgi:hypothetical protein
MVLLHLRYKGFFDKIDDITEIRITTNSFAYLVILYLFNGIIGNLYNHIVRQNSKFWK